MTTQLSDREIEKILSDLEDDYKYVKENPIDSMKLPSNFSLMVHGAKDNKAIDFILSSGLDHMIDKMMDLYYNTGSVDEIINNVDLIDNIVKKTGLYSKDKTKAFITNRLFNTLKKTTSDEKFNDAKSNLRKLSIVIGSLRKESRKIKDKPTRKKYDSVLNSFIKFFRFIGKIYRNRRLINERVQNDISYVLTENLSFDSYESELQLEKIL